MSGPPPTDLHDAEDFAPDDRPVLPPRRSRPMWQSVGAEEPKPVIYNVNTHDTAPSINQGVRLVWPAVSSSY